MSDVAVITCGVLTQHVDAICERRGLDVSTYPLPPLLHQRPERIAPAVRELAEQLAAEHGHVVVAYADCGTYGALDGVCGSSASSACAVATATTSLPVPTASRSSTTAIPAPSC